MTDLREKDHYLLMPSKLIEKGNEQVFIVGKINNQKFVLRSAKAYSLAMPNNRFSSIPDFIKPIFLKKTKGDFKIAEKKLNLEEMELIAFTIRRKPKRPVFFGIVKENKKFYAIKMGLNKTAKKIIKKEFKTLKKINLLNPKIKNGILIIDFVKGENSAEAGEKAQKKAVQWIADFHSEKSNGFYGQMNGDFSPYDSIIDKQGGINIVDWEDYCENGAQLTDIFGFIHKLRPNELPKDFLGRINSQGLFKYYLSKRGLNITNKELKKQLKIFCNYSLKRHRKIFGYPISNDKFFNELLDIIKKNN